MELLLPKLRGKRVALMANQSSVVGQRQTHLLDTLLSSKVRVKKIFVPEHGFRGTVDAGKYVRHGRDVKTGLPIISLYGKQKRPTPKMLEDVDVIVFDLQDVGARFYTYISSMHYLMEAAAEEQKQLIVCDRPNPNDYIDGPILEADCKSFIGMHPIPTMHGMTVGELARMINGERWLRGGKPCTLDIIPIEGWQHGQPYTLPVRPSPNLPDARSIELYPSLCFFEATILSVGRGTQQPFRILGYPHRAYGAFTFTPKVTPGADSNPKHKGQVCYGVDLTDEVLPKGQLSLKWLIHYYHLAGRNGHKLIDRPRTFELIAGNKLLAKQLEAGLSEAEIRQSWQQGLELFKRKRKQYLLYPDHAN
ncbi:MAG: DUF1343 domain-containing protein [Porphyromonadaceae bacterium]|nr:DUF1343 domain-containing protein [Porphyromonadaceae bacterium]